MTQTSAPKKTGVRGAIKKPVVKKEPYMREIGPLKLKDQIGKNMVRINLNDFGFYPTAIIIEKLRGENNKFRVVAVE